MVSDSLRCICSLAIDSLRRLGRPLVLCVYLNSVFVAGYKAKLDSSNAAGEKYYVACLSCVCLVSRFFFFFLYFVSFLVLFNTRRPIQEESLYLV